MPGWDSLTAVAWLHNFFQFAGLVAAILLALGAAATYAHWRGSTRPHPVEIAGAIGLVVMLAAGLLAHRYSIRKDDMVQTERLAMADQFSRQAKAIEAAHVAKSADAQGELARARQQLSEAEAAFRARLAAAEARLAESEKKVAAFQQAQKDKRLSEAEKKALIAALKPFSGQKVTIASAAGDQEGRALAEDFVAVFDAAGWDHNGEAGVFTREWNRDPVGIEVTLNEDDARANQIPAGVGALISVVRQLGLAPGNTIYINDDVRPGETQVKVGKKLHK